VAKDKLMARRRRDALQDPAGLRAVWREDLPHQAAEPNLAAKAHIEQLLIEERSEAKLEEKLRTLPWRHGAV
jgi:hypothetical protein